MEPIKPHDLLYINYKDLVKDDPLPEWLDRHQVTDWAVVRRANVSDELIPVGLRGRNRNERFACWVNPSNIKKRVSPYELVNQNFLDGISKERQEQFEVFNTLKQLRKLLSSYKWGVGGSLGYELVSQRPAVKQTSDIDVIIESVQPLSSHQKQELLNICQQLPNRADIQIITPYGGCSLLELCQNNQHILLKTLSGPKLVVNPWNEPKETIERLF